MLQQLVGESIRGVVYHDCHEDNLIPIVAGILKDNPKRSHDMICHGIDLVLNSGRTFSFFWEQFGSEFELDVLPESVFPAILKNSSCRYEIDGAHDPEWCTRIGRTIRSIRLSADQHGTPCVCEIGFENGPSVWICTIRESVPFESSDDVVVLFDPEEAKRIGISIDAD